MNSKKLQKELYQAGASSQEISQLVTVANNLKLLKHQLATNSSLSIKPKQINFVFTTIVSATFLVIGIFLVSFSQTVLPGNTLYPVQKLSDTIAVSVDPNYRADLMMKRAEQVNILISNHANTSLVLATLSDYQTQALAYQANSKNYAAFEYCKTNLEQAASNAPAAERNAINAALLSIKNT